MKVKSTDFEFFKKLKIKSVIDLALILPKKIENLNLTPKPNPNEICTQKVQIKSVGFKTTNFLEFVNAKCGIKSFLLCFLMRTNGIIAFVRLEQN